MQLIKEDEGIKLIQIENNFYLEYDAGSHMVKKKRIEISLFYSFNNASETTIATIAITCFFSIFYNNKKSVDFQGVIDCSFSRHRCIFPFRQKPQ